MLVSTFIPFVSLLLGPLVPSDFPQMQSYPTLPPVLTLFSLSPTHIEKRSHGACQILSLRAALCERAPHRRGAREVVVAP